jgi:peroxiredoxin (alkyl hydroperoxide reductase subunit C)
MEDKIFLMPRIGDMAPDFEAVTTGNLKFSEYNKGSWVVFFPILLILHPYVQQK